MAKEKENSDFDFEKILQKKKAENQALKKILKELEIKHNKGKK